MHNENEQGSEDHSLGKGQDGQDAPPASRAQRGDGRDGAAAPRLDNRTYLDKENAKYSIRVRDYGAGLCEIGWSFVGSILFFKAGRGESAERDVHEFRAKRRASSRIRQLVLSANADHLLTLTYRANVTEYHQTAIDLGRFIRRVKIFLSDWVYIAVPERQQRGAWHWHLAVVGRQDVELLRDCWRFVVGDGNIDVQKPKNRTANRRLALVRYLGKYLAKGFEEEERALNGHRYRASLGIQVPSQRIELPPEHRSNVPQFIQDQLRARTGEVGFEWIDPQGMAGWACSWGSK